ncbi:MAG: dipeptide epimerase [Bacteroidia bacterium]|nr:dipeptide epimerase [Bacteroidia bacterium]
MELNYRLYFLEFIHPFGVSSNTRRETPSVFIELDANDNRGYGEACLPAYLGETVEATISFFNLAKSYLKKLKIPFDVETCMADIDSLKEGHNAAKAAIDIALHDLKGKIDGKSVAQFYGLSEMDSGITSFTIGIDSEPVLAQKIKEAEEFRILKIKAGTSDDKALMNMIRKYTDKPLYVDVNQGWKNKEHALEMAMFMKDENVLLLEQPMPVNMKKEMAWLTERSPVPTFGDESVKRLKDLKELDGAFHGVNIKLMKSAGLSEALKMIDFCKEKKIKVFLGCMAESSCATGAMAQIISLADHIDLDAPLLYKNDPFEGIHYKNGRISPGSSPGIGVKPQVELFK